ncbi:MAG: glycosyltransferase [Proteobacteria bacterium]|nr:MAG: glycosyltransferase [Pseudomonadota bacterium]
MDISIIIPFRDKPELMNDCLSTFSKLCSSHTNYSVEFLLIDNGSSEATLKALNFPEHLSIRTIRADIPFNFQSLINLGVKEAIGKYYLLLNNDIVFTEKSSDFLNKMMASAQLPNAGAVGGLLLYEDGTIQHAGVVVGMGGFADHLYRTWTKEQSVQFTFSAYNENRAVSAVTAALLLVEAKKFHQIGGFDERFIVCGGDVDFCLRLSEAGYVNYYRGDFEMIHLESKSRDPAKIPEIDFAESLRSYGQFLSLHGGRDPFYPEPLPLKFEPDDIFLGRRFRKGSLAAIKPARTVGAMQKANFERLRRLRRKLRMEPPEMVLAQISLKIRRKLFSKNAVAFRVERSADSYAIPHAVPVRHHREFSENPKRRLNILLPHLEPKGIYGGIATATLIALKFKAANPDVDLRFLLTDGEGSFEALDTIMKPFFGAAYDDIEYEIQTLYNRKHHSVGVHQNDRFVTTAWWTCNSAKSICGNSPFLYLIQDYEPCFYPWSEEYAGAAASYNMNFVPIFNTDVLRDFFEIGKIVSQEQIDKGAYFNPAIDGKFFKPKTIVDKSPKSKRRLFFYGRPSVARNLFSTGVQALSRAVKAGILNANDWEFVSAGEMHDAVELDTGVYMKSIGKMSYQEYADILKEIDIGMSLMLSPHPSYPPLEIASVGNICVTNGYANKDLSQWHPNIISCEPSVDGIVDGLEKAVSKLNSGDIVDPVKALSASKISFDWDESLKSTLTLIQNFCRN